VKRKTSAVSDLMKVVLPMESILNLKMMAHQLNLEQYPGKEKSTLKKAYANPGMNCQIKKAKQYRFV